MRRGGAAHLARGLPAEVATCAPARHPLGRAPPPGSPYRSFAGTEFRLPACMTSTRGQPCGRAR